MRTTKTPTNKPMQIMTLSRKKIRGSVFFVRRAVGEPAAEKKSILRKFQQARNAFFYDHNMWSMRMISADSLCAVQRHMV